MTMKTLCTFMHHAAKYCVRIEIEIKKLIDLAGDQFSII